MTLRAVDGDGLPNRMMSARAGVGAMPGRRRCPNEITPRLWVGRHHPVGGTTRVGAACSETMHASVANASRVPIGATCKGGHPDVNEHQEDYQWRPDWC